MLDQLLVKNFAVVKHLAIDFNAGLTAITGETGAGKSIAIDALGLCLGERAEANSVRKGSEKAEIIAHFNITHIAAAKHWLNDNELQQEDNPNECFIRRVVSNEGRSKAFVNGVVVSLQQLKSLGLLLVTIHGQHAHQQLLKQDNQRKLLDNYADHSLLLSDIKSIFTDLKAQRKKLNDLTEKQQQITARKQLLSYQVQELDEFALAENEFEQLEIEQKRLSNSQTLLEQAQLSFYQLYEADEFNALSLLRSSVDKLVDLEEHDPQLSPIIQMLETAAIDVEEASKEIQGYCENLDIDPIRMSQVEQRYTTAMDLARKHQVKPENLYATHLQLIEEFQGLEKSENDIETLTQQCDKLSKRYLDAAVKLSKSRQKAATLLARDIEAHVSKMNMQHTKLTIEINFDSHATANSLGNDEILFKVTTNPGQPADVLEKVVSGGELSRIGLAIQVITSNSNHIPTMIFDEVDTGISGPTAAVVGQLLRTLGINTQVLCVTHLPQVAAQGHNQLFVTKITDGTSTETRMLKLSESERVNELARLLAGDTLTETAIANAKEMLKAKVKN